MSLSGLIGETFIQSELDYRRERAMHQYSRHTRRHAKRHLAWPFGRHPAAQRRPSRPAVS